MFEVYNEYTSHISLNLLVCLPVNFSWGSFMNNCNDFVMDYISTFFQFGQSKESLPYS